MRERELQWLKDHQDQLERLQGRWVAIEGDKLISDGESFEVVYRAAKENGIEMPFIFLVPPKEDVVLVGF